MQSYFSKLISSDSGGNGTQQQHLVLSLLKVSFVIKKTFIERSDVIEAELLQRSSSMRRSASVPAIAMA